MIGIHEGGGAVNPVFAAFFGCAAWFWAASGVGRGQHAAPAARREEERC